jgi:hypothetical protein
MEMSHVKASSSFTEKYCVACPHLCTVRIIKHSFELTGRYIMAYCTRTIPAEEEKVMKDNFPRMVESFKSKGYLTEKGMDDVGIVRVEDGRSKDNDMRVMHQNRALIVNSAANLARFAKNSIPEGLEAVGRKQAKAATKKVKPVKPKAATVVKPVVQAACQVSKHVRKPKILYEIAFSILNLLKLDL